MKKRPKDAELYKVMMRVACGEFKEAVLVINLISVKKPHKKGAVRHK